MLTTHHLPESSRVLVVDDDHTMRLLARASLEQSGFVVEEAEDGGMALAVFQGLQPNLIRLDVLMPKPSTPKSLCKGKEKS